MRLFICVMALALCGASLTSPYNPEPQGAHQFDWHAFGKEIMANTNRPRLATELDRAKYITGKVAEKMAQLGVAPNGNYVSRFGSYVTYGQQDVGTCGWCDQALQKAMMGGGFKAAQLYSIVGEAGKLDRLKANRNHAGTGVIINGKLSMFDLWSHGRATGSFAGMSGSAWNGRPFKSWFSSIRHYRLFSWYGPVNTYKTSDLFPDHLEENVLGDYFGQTVNRAKKVIKGLADPKKATKPKETKVVGARWELIGTETKRPKDADLKEPRYQRYTAEGEKGKLKVGATWNDIGLKEFSCSATFKWMFSKPVETLKPGDKLMMTGTLTTEGDSDKASAGGHWGLPGLESHVVMQGSIDFGAVDVYGKNGSGWYEKPIEVPKGTFFSGKMTLRVICYVKGCMGSFDYIYKWVPK